MSFLPHVRFVASAFAKIPRAAEAATPVLLANNIPISENLSRGLPFLVVNLRFSIWLGCDGLVNRIGQRWSR